MKKRSNIAPIAIFLLPCSWYTFWAHLSLTFFHFQSNRPLFIFLSLLPALFMVHELGLHLDFWWDYLAWRLTRLRFYRQATSSPFVPNGNIYSAIIAIVPRILIGLTPYLVYKLMKNKTGLILAGALGSLTNTIFVLGGIFFLFGNVYNGNIQLLLATVISTNSIAELVISAILTLAIVPRLQTLKK